MWAEVMNWRKANSAGFALDARPPVCLLDAYKHNRLAVLLLATG
jgi:hypothetical protein